MYRSINYSDQHMRRYSVILQTIQTSLSTSTAAEMLGISRRQVFRLKTRVRKRGPTGIRHGNCGRTPANAKPDRLRQRVTDIYRKECPDFNFTHFTETLAEEFASILSRETIRGWLREQRLGPKPHHSHGHRRCRERKAHFGDMLFLDGSPHPWLGPDLTPLTLMLCTDDATGRPIYGLFAPQETRDACFEVLYHVFLRYGMPVSLYLDRASQFTTTRHGGTHSFQRDDRPTYSEIAMQKLAIQLIFAHSPQARGRGERINGSFQDRLVAELDHHHITDPVRANDYLNRVFIPKYAKRFGVKPRDPNSAFRPIPEGLDLRTVFCARTTREVANDNTIRYHGRVYQLKPNTRSVCIAGTQVLVEEWFDGSVHVRHDKADTIAVTPVLDRHQPHRRPRRTHYDVFAVASV
jgi:transposase